MLRKQYLILVLISMFVQTACAGAVVTVTSVPTPTEVTPMDACPTATAELKLLKNTEAGYCLLYPANYSGDIQGLVVINPVPEPGGDMPGDAWVLIQVEAANERTAAQVAEAAITAAGTGFNIAKSEILINGAQAVVVDGIPEQDSNRKVFAVSNDRLYTLTFQPWYPSTDASQLTPLEGLYTTIINTLHFMP